MHNVLRTTPLVLNHAASFVTTSSVNEYDSRLPFRKAVYAAVWASLSAGICQAQHAHKKEATWLKGPGSHSAFGDAAFGKLENSCTRPV